MLPRALLRSSRRFTTKPMFDAEASRLYEIVAMQHIHPNGPWGKMTDKTKELLLGTDGGAILDLATGPGEPAGMIATALPSATVWATDVSEDMLKTAKGRIHADNVNFELVDMSSIPFDDSTFDVVTVCYGYMFPEDKQRAVEETFRVLRPGGTLVATYWLDLPFMSMVKEVMTEVLGTTPPPPPINPMALAAPGVFDSMLEKAGFESITTEVDAYPFNFTADQETQLGIGLLTVKAALDEIGGDAHDRATTAFWKHAPDYTTTAEDGNMHTSPNKFAMVVASKPV